MNDKSNSKDASCTLREAAEYALDYLVACNQRFNVDPEAIEKLRAALAAATPPERMIHPLEVSVDAAYGAPRTLRELITGLREEYALALLDPEHSSRLAYEQFIDDLDETLAAATPATCNVCGEILEEQE